MIVEKWQKHLAGGNTLLSLTATIPVFAQQQEQPSTEELIAPHVGPGGEFAQPILIQQQQACGADITVTCAQLIYASANVVVLTGEVLPELQVNRRFNNDFIWQAVEQIKSQGFSIQHVSIFGEGNDLSPARLYVVMAK
jgi:hypothetical protein